MNSMTKFALAGALAFSVPAPALAIDGDAAAGQRVFNRCAICHGIGDASKPVGPSLNNVIGRTAGTLEEFASKYSAAMIAAGEGGLVWTAEEIDEYITNPREKIPGNKMVFPGLRSEKERADVIAYIATYSEATGEEGEDEEASESN